MNRDQPAPVRRILCIDDDTYLTGLLRYALSRAGFTVHVANSGAAALRATRRQPPDLVLLDLTLPDADGLEICTYLRGQCRLPVIILSGREGEAAIARGFECGADDYITKPFSMHVLIYRIEAVLRRTHPVAVERPAKRLLRVHDGWLDTEQHQLSRHGATVKLTATESKIFSLLLVHDGQALSAERILDAIWDYDSETNVSVIKTHIRYLRGKLATLFADVQLIHTVRGLGYTYRRDQAMISVEQAAG